jgi:molybdate transport system substrate-binding protein
MEKNGLAVAGSQFTYATGQLVLWSATPGLIDDQGLILQRDSASKLALANPKVAPYGMAAVEVLRKLNLDKQTRHRWVQGENIAQTYQFIATGNAELGFVALSQLKDKNHQVQGSFWIIPQNLYSPIRQDAVILTRGENNEAIKQLMQFMQSNKALTIIQAYGYKID